MTFRGRESRITGLVLGLGDYAGFIDRIWGRNTTTVAVW